MKTSVNTYSFGHYVNDLGIYGVIDKTKEIGFDGIEFVEAGWMNVPDEELKKIGNRRALHRSGFCQRLCRRRKSRNRKGQKAC